MQTLKFISKLAALTMTTPEPNWKAHPVYYVGLGIVLGIAFAMQWLAPARDGELRLEVLDARRRIETASNELKEQIEKTAAAGKVAHDLRVELDKAKKDLFDAQFSGVFAFGSPYPIGLSSVRIGDHVAKIEEVYGVTRLTKSDGYWSITLDHRIFHSITYYFDASEKIPKVRHVLLQRSHDKMVDDEFLKRKLTEALGDHTSSPRAGYFAWEGKSTHSIFLRPLGNILVMPDKMTPAIWPKKRSIETGTIK